MVPVSETLFGDRTAGLVATLMSQLLKVEKPTTLTCEKRIVPGEARDWLGGLMKSVAGGKTTTTRVLVR
jgi:hypothetical protein